ncbi:MAG: hypothetical protein COA42_21475 [Alteromonadaceae bacterium]|nr:MAG: hypothetical protein COA42_21475 [Alteromonadaceae bacterium]
MVDGLPIFVSNESSGIYTDVQYDEKHYFVVPYLISKHKFALHTLRCLPKLAPEINDLAKRRVFHFPNEHSETMLKAFMLERVNKSLLSALEKQHQQQFAKHRRLNTLQSL